MPVEPDPMTYNITVSGIKPAITPKTKAIIPVHLYGQPVDVDAITKLARPLGLKVIEDAAQCHGSALRDVMDRMEMQSRGVLSRKI